MRDGFGDVRRRTRPQAGAGGGLTSSAPIRIREICVPRASAADLRLARGHRLKAHGIQDAAYARLPSPSAGISLRMVQRALTAAGSNGRTASREMAQVLSPAPIVKYSAANETPLKVVGLGASLW